MKARKLILRILIAAALVAGALVAVLVGVIVFDSLFPKVKVTDLTNTSYPGANGVTLHAYLAQAESGQPSPAILLVHEFYGLRPDIIKKANLLAEQGYTVLAVDAYRGKTTGLIPRAIWLVMSTPQEEISADLDAGFQYLSQLPGVDPQRIGAVGFCFGGTQVMRLGTRNPNLAATVIYYGSGPITNAAELGVLGQSGPVLGIYGQEDNSIPVTEVRAFEAAMTSKGIRNEVTVYPGVGHAFVNSETLAQPGPAQEAWQQMLAFLERNLRPGS